MTRWLSVLLCAIIVLHSVIPCLCWDQDDLDLFDLVEEIGDNFYDILQLDQRTSLADIKRAYRRLSLQMHPDKSEDPNATENFRKLVAVYEVLKDPEKREKYDEILEVGLPDWKEPVFYYRKVRKMGLLEVSFILLGATSVGQYLYGWAVYAEKQLVLQDLVSRKLKKEQRKMKQLKAQVAHQRLESELEMRTAEVKASKPRFRDLLPFMLLRHLFLLLVALCGLARKKLGKDVSSDSPKVNGIAGKGYENSKKHIVVKASPRRRKGRGGGVGEVDSSDGEFDQVSEPVPTEVKGVEELKKGRGGGVEEKRVGGECKAEVQVVSGKCEAARGGDGGRTRGSGGESAVGKGGSARGGDGGGAKGRDREGGVKQIGRDGGRKEEGKAEDSGSNKGRGRDVLTVGTEVLAEGTSTSNISKQNDWKVSGSGQDKSSKTVKRKTSPPEQKRLLVNGRVAKEEVSSHTSIGANKSTAVDTEVRNGSVPDGNEAWTQTQQRLLEWSLNQYPKFSEGRWVKIAMAVPGKSEEECMYRCVHLYEELKLKKAF